MSRKGLEFYNGRVTDYIPEPDYNNSDPVNHSRYHDYAEPSKSHYNEVLSSYSDSGSMSNGKDPWTYGKIGRRFAERTSMQGIPYILHSKTRYAKVAWTIIFVIGTGAMIFHLYYLSNIYFQFNKKTSVTLGFESLSFPAVTFCNVNPMKRSERNLASADLQELLEAVKPSNVANLYQKSIAPQSGTLPKDPLPAKSQLSRKKRFLDKLDVPLNDSSVDEGEYFNEDEWENIGTMDETDKVYGAFISLFNSEPRHKRLKMGHDIKDMLVKCSFAGRTCHPENFTQMTNSHYGNCYTLETSVFKSRRSGPDQGLELMFYLENNEYIRGITNGNGAQVLIHDRNVMPHPYDQGIAVSSGAETMIGLNLLRISRMGKPYGECENIDDFSKAYGVKFTRTSCQKFCEAKLIMDNCNCTNVLTEEVNLKIGNTRDLPDNCRTDKEQKCLIKTVRKYERGDLTCRCHDPCQETKYTKSLSSRQWPSNDYGELLLDILCDKQGDDECKAIEQTNARTLAQNFVKLNIYFEDLNYQNITEGADYEESQFASDIGGTIGLWIGLSALSMMEVFQFLAELIGHMCCGRKPNKDNSKKKLEIHMDRRNELNGHHNNSFKY